MDFSKYDVGKGRVAKKDAGWRCIAGGLLSRKPAPLLHDRKGKLFQVPA